MTPQTILEQTENDGVDISLSDSGDIKATGDKKAITRWLPILREHKQVIIEELHTGLTINTQIEIISAWLHKIGEPESDHYLVLDKCRRDPEALAYFLELSQAAQQT